MTDNENGQEKEEGVLPRDLEFYDEYIKQVERRLRAKRAGVTTLRELWIPQFTRLRDRAETPYEFVRYELRLIETYAKVFALQSELDNLEVLLTEAEHQRNMLLSRRNADRLAARTRDRVDDPVQVDPDDAGLR